MGWRVTGGGGEGPKRVGVVKSGSRWGREEG